MTLHLRPLTLLDLIGVCCELPADELAQDIAFRGAPEGVEDRASRLFRAPGPKWTIAPAGGRAVACGGLIPLRPGVAETWFLATPDAWVPGITELVESVKCDALLHEYHRIETYCLASRLHAQKWYTRMGLHKEATLQKFCADGQDAVLFVAIRGDT